jgi:small subunit ribosomal protein S13
MKQEQKQEFKHLVRIAGKDIKGEKNVVHGLSLIKGIGPRTAMIVCSMAGVSRNKKTGHLTDKNIEDITKAINGLEETPAWLLNRQRDYDGGKNRQLIGPDLLLSLREDLNRMKKTRSYKGIRHESGLPVRGQRTRSTFRGNVTVGVSRKKTLQAQKQAQKQKKER